MDILNALRKLCGVDGARPTLDEIAAEAGVSTKTVRRMCEGLEAERVLTVDHGGGRGNKATVAVNMDRLARAEALSRFATDDPSDLTPGAEYNPIPPGKLDEVRADRARMMHARTGQWPSWATREAGA